MNIIAPEITLTPAEILALTDEPGNYPQPVVHINWITQQIQLSWGSLREPYIIRFEQVKTLRELVGWMARLTGKTWFHGEVARNLGVALTEVYKSQLSPLAADKKQL